MEREIKTRAVMFAKNSLVLVKWLVGFGIVCYLLTILDFSKFKGAILGADLRYLPAGAAFVLAARILYAWQTAIAVREHGIPLTTKRALVINTISGFYNLFLPGDLSAGVVKWYKLSKPAGRKAEVLAAILFVKILNTSFFLAFGIIGFLIDSPLNSVFLFCTLLSLFFGLAIISIGFFSQRIAVWQETIFKCCPPWIPSSILDGLRRALFSLAKYRTMSWNKFFRLLSVPFINLVLITILLFLVARSLNFWIPIHALIWIWSMVYIIHITPATISGLGLREGVLVYLLPYYGVDPASAMAFSLIIFSFTVLAALIGGMLEAKEVLLSPR
ncbi:MAG: YbhN family protein [Candidatus Hodarchaeota archaeon]